MPARRPSRKRRCSANRAGRRTTDDATDTKVVTDGIAIATGTVVIRAIGIVIAAAAGGLITRTRQRPAMDGVKDVMDNVTSASRANIRTAHAQKAGNAAATRSSASALRNSSNSNNSSNSSSRHSSSQQRRQRSLKRPRRSP